MKAFNAVALVAMTTLAVSAGPVFAAWPKLPTQNLPLAAPFGAQTAPASIADGKGGAIVVWQDRRSGTNDDLYAGRVGPDGILPGDTLYYHGGVLLCANASDQRRPVIAADGAGGAYVAWEDYRTGAATPDIYAQHVLASGLVDPAWPIDGLPVAVAAFDQSLPAIIPDGSGGCLISWTDGRNPITIYDIYAQHVLATGHVDPAWPANGQILCQAHDGQGSQTMVGDGAGGAIVAWHDFRTRFWDIYAQHVKANGSVDPAWPVDGRALCTAAGHQTYPTIASDGAGGAIVTWEDPRSGAFDIYAQHVLASGAVDPAWPADGRAICTAAGDQNAPQIGTDGATPGGAIIAWRDKRGLAPDLYAEHVSNAGIVDPAWTPNGVPMLGAVADLTTPALLPDGAGGVLIGWDDVRSGEHDIYAQHLLASGVFDPAWRADDLPVCTAPLAQTLPVMVTDAHGGAILCWADARTDAGDIYAQRIWADGLLGPSAPVILDITDVPMDQGGWVMVHWEASFYDPDPQFDWTITRYTVWRRVPGPLALTANGRGARANTPANTADARGTYRTTVQGAQTVYWEWLGNVPAIGQEGYVFSAGTLADSVSPPPPCTAYMVVAERPGQRWYSAPDSGYSLDNLAPAPPTPLTSTFFSGASYLHWYPNLEPDLAGYRLYRGFGPAFVTDPSNLVATTSSTNWTDPAAGAAYYKLIAVDVHGNASAATPIVVTYAAGVGSGTQAPALGLSAPFPNPVTRSTTFRFALPRATRARLALYDAAGREVRSLVDGPLEAGEQTAPWDLRDREGRSVGAGLYFLELVTAEGARMRRVVVTR